MRLPLSGHGSFYKGTAVKTLILALLVAMVTESDVGGLFYYKARYLISLATGHIFWKY